MQSITFWGQPPEQNTHLLDPACKCLSSLCKQMQRGEKWWKDSFYVLLVVSVTSWLICWRKKLNRCIVPCLNKRKKKCNLRTSAFDFGNHGNISTSLKCNACSIGERDQSVSAAWFTNRWRWWRCDWSSQFLLHILINRHCKDGFSCQ